MNHAALEAVFGDTAFELVRSPFGIGRRKRGKSGVAAGMPLDRFLQPVVRSFGKRNRSFGIEALNRRRALRQHLHVNPGFVHLADAAIIDIVETVADRCAGKALLFAETGRNLRIEIMFFQRDDAIAGLARHVKLLRVRFVGAAECINRMGTCQPDAG